MIKAGCIFSIVFASIWLCISLFDDGQTEIDQLHNDIVLTIWTVMIFVMGGLNELKDKK